jgi:glycosyltransferase involved in cell wall biosynthesis
VQLFTHAHNQGKGAGIRTALEHASGDAVIIQDADLEYFPEDYVELLGWPMSGAALARLRRPRSQRSGFRHALRQ